MISERNQHAEHGTPLDEKGWVVGLSSALGEMTGTDYVFGERSQGQVAHGLCGRSPKARQSRTSRIAVGLENAPGAISERSGFATEGWPFTVAFTKRSSGYTEGISKRRARSTCFGSLAG